MVIGIVKLVLVCIQKASYEFQAELCFFQVLLVVECNIKFSIDFPSLSTLSDNSLALSKCLYIYILFFTSNFQTLSSPKSDSMGSGANRLFFFGILNANGSLFPCSVPVNNYVCVLTINTVFFLFYNIFLYTFFVYSTVVHFIFLVCIVPFPVP